MLVVRTPRHNRDNYRAGSVAATDVMTLGVTYGGTDSNAG
jgi:hypothetical protein